MCDGCSCDDPGTPVGRMLSRMAIAIEGNLLA